jgi:hypothetical protein
MNAIDVDGTVTVFRVFRLAATADEVIARVAAHVAADPHPEIDEAVAIRSPDPAAHHYPDFIPPILEWLFAGNRR